MLNLINTYQQSWASLKKTPVFVGTVLATLGTTIGALLVVITLAYLLLLEPLPYPDQERLVRVDHALFNENNINNLTAFTYPGLIHLYKNQNVFDQASLINYENDVLLSSIAQPLVNTAYVTPEWFSLLNASLVLGRGFEPSEGLNTHNPVVVLSYETWKNEYQFDQDIVGKKVTIKGKSFSIIGVMDKSFIEPRIYSNSTTAIWLPWDFNSNAMLANKWGHIRPNLTFIGKLKTNVSFAQAEQSISNLVNDIWQQNVADISLFDGWQIQMHIRSLHEIILGDTDQTAYLLLCAILGLLIIACTNIANLFMSRVSEQKRNYAIRAAVGAKSNHIFNHFFTESILLMFFSTVIGLLVASTGIWLTKEVLMSTLPRIEELSINDVTLVSAVISVLLLATFFAWVCNKMIDRKHLITQLHTGGKGTSKQVSKLVRNAFLAAQVTIASVIVFASMNVFDNSLAKIIQPLNFSTNNNSHMVLSSPRDLSTDERKATMLEMIEKLKRLPSVTSISQSNSPLIATGQAAFITADTNSRYTVENRRVDDKYFKLIQQPLLEGRYFNYSDIKDQNPVIIINQSFAKHIAPDKSAVGMTLSTPNNQSLTIIGVVKGIVIPGSSNVPMRSYRPATLSSATLLLSTQENQELARSELLNLIQETAPNWTLFDYTPLKKIHDQLLFTKVSAAVSSLIIATFTLFLSGVGIYGLVNHNTRLRQFELGIHLAIGAKKRDVVNLVLSDNMRPIYLGMFTSAIIMLVTINYLNFGSDSGLHLDFLISITLTFTFILTMSLLACYLPLRKYINTRPINNLRSSYD
ncbi:ABC transporter permease [Thalassotalea fusca]